MLLSFEEFIRDFFMFAIIASLAYFCGYAVGRGEKKGRESGDKGGHF